MPFNILTTINTLFPMLRALEHLRRGFIRKHMDDIQKQGIVGRMLPNLRAQQQHSAAHYDDNPGSGTPSW